MSETYFTPATLRFLRDLGRHNNRDWFAANKPRLEEVLRQPFLRLLGDLQAPLAKISSHFVADTRTQGGSLFRMHRDTRFANDKTPYKTWAGAKLYHERARQTEAPSFYLHVQPGSSFVGAGLWRPQPESVKRIRDFLADNPAAWKKATRSKAFTTYFAFGGESLKRPPRGFEATHELIEDLKRKDFTAWQNLDDEVVTSGELKPIIVDRLKRLAPMIDYVCASLELEF